MQVLLTVIVVTYNHRDFIAQALHSIDMQAVSFDFEVLVADDASTDGAQAVITERANRWGNPRGKLQVLLRDKNIGMQGNALDVLRRASGKFIALLDGDDYWSDPQKLEIQVGFLEKNPDYFLCAHKTAILEDNNLHKYEWRLNPLREQYSTLNYIERLFFHTSSIVMRHRKAIPDWLLHVKQLDQAIVLLNSDSASDKIKIFPKVMSVYRIHKGGVTRSHSHQNRRTSSWSYLRLLCGLIRDSHSLEKDALRRKMRETLLVGLLRSNVSFIRYIMLSMGNIPTILKLAIYKIKSY